ncbi:ATP-binding cassette domain-containing protein, partial [Burkholderia multivorans]|uniref:ATP-binding cassette domain-containing protein n=1 Tax=Burkholderia multivorans TaxID=87883 RepID=UPI001C655E8D
MTETLVDVTDLTITPAGSGEPVLDSVSLRLVPGERVGLIGESGSGKSLTAASIMGLLPDELHATGTIRLAGFDGDVLTASEKRLARMRADLVSMVFQEPMSALNPMFRVGHHIAEAVSSHTRRPAPDLARRVVRRPRTA